MVDDIEKNILALPEESRYVFIIDIWLETHCQGILVTPKLFDFI